MYAYKQFLAQDIKIIPFTVNKSFNFYGISQMTSSNNGIDIFIGLNTTGTFIPALEPTTGYLTTRYKRLVYNSVKELYYSNYLSSSYGDNVGTSSLIPGKDEEGNVLVGPINSPLYDNYLQTTLSYPKYFPTESNGKIGVLSIPSKLYGDYVQPKSFKLYGYGEIIDPPFTNSYDIFLQDDGEGNIVSNTSASYIMGNIFYPQGIITLTKDITWSDYTGSLATFYLGFDGQGKAGDTLEFEIDSVIVATITFTDGVLPAGTDECISPDDYPGTINDWVDLILIPVLQANSYLSVYFPDINNTNFGVTTGDAFANLTSTLALIPPGLTMGFTPSFTMAYAVAPANYETVVSFSLIEFLGQTGSLSCSFSSSYTLFESQYKCTIKENEFNFSLNPSLITNDSTGSLHDFATGSYFSPYITTIGLYNDNKELLAVGKLSQPLQTSPVTDTSILINIDR